MGHAFESSTFVASRLVLGMSQRDWIDWCIDQLSDQYHEENHLTNGLLANFNQAVWSSGLTTASVSHYKLPVSIVHVHMNITYIMSKPLPPIRVFVQKDFKVCWF